MRTRINRRRKNAKNFNPGHAELASAVQEFMNHGGQIHKIAATDDNLNVFLEKKDERAVDEFLLGGVVESSRW
ncbi:MAG: hypothetical protein RRB13_11080 [bacterium]|nr:hypothetical protein [bacterium]